MPVAPGLSATRHAAASPRAPSAESGMCPLSDQRLNRKPGRLGRDCRVKNGGASMVGKILDVLDVGARLRGVSG